MLVLTRREGERTFIGKDITVTVVSTQRGQVRLGIDAPKDVTILREEVQKRIDREKAAECMENCREKAQETQKAAEEPEKVCECGENGCKF